jgi:hypothetical protein
MKKQTAVEWFYDKIKSHFEHDGDLLEALTFTMAIAKQKEKEQIVESYRDGRSDQQSERQSKFYNRTAEQYYNNEK